MNKSDLINFLEPFSDDVKLTIAVETENGLVLNEYAINEIKYIPSEISEPGLPAHILIMGKEFSEFNKHTVECLNKESA